MFDNMSYGTGAQTPQDTWNEPVKRTFVCDDCDPEQHEHLEESTTREKKVCDLCGCRKVKGNFNHEAKKEKPTGATCGDCMSKVVSKDRLADRTFTDVGLPLTCNTCGTKHSEKWMLSPSVVKMYIAHREVSQANSVKSKKRKASEQTIDCTSLESTRATNGGVKPPNDFDHGRIVSAHVNGDLMTAAQKFVVLGNVLATEAFDGNFIFTELGMAVPHTTPTLRQFGTTINSAFEPMVVSLNTELKNSPKAIASALRPIRSNHELSIPLDDQHLATSFSDGPIKVTRDIRYFLDTNDAGKKRMIIGLEVVMAKRAFREAQTRFDGPFSFKVTGKGATTSGAANDLANNMFNAMDSLDQLDPCERVAILAAINSIFSSTVNSMAMTVVATTMIDTQQAEIQRLEDQLEMAESRYTKATQDLKESMNTIQDIQEHAKNVTDSVDTNIDISAINELAKATTTAERIRVITDLVKKHPEREEFSDTLSTLTALHMAEERQREEAKVKQAKRIKAAQEAEKLLDRIEEASSVSNTPSPTKKRRVGKSSAAPKASTRRFLRSHNKTSSQ